jgi:hypothetical protein
MGILGMGSSRVRGWGGERRVESGEERVESGEERVESGEERMRAMKRDRTLFSNLCSLILQRKVGGAMPK